MDAAQAGMFSGFGNLIGSMINADASYRNTQSTNVANMLIAQYGYDQQKEMIRQQNEYNSPLQQLKRYTEAGLNPNLIYGEGKASAGNQSDIAKLQAPNLQTPHIDFGDLGVTSGVTAYLQMKQLELQNKKTEAEVERMNMQNLLTDRYVKQSDAELKYYNLLHADGAQSPAFENYSADIRLKNQQYSLRELERDYTNARIEYQKLSNQEKVFYNKYLLPLALEAKKLEVVGMSYENIIRKIDAETERLIRQSAVGSTPFRAAYGLGAVLGDRLREGWQRLMRKRSLRK